ncbi:MAG: hypothetical protein M1819_005663 [Sarea resinae]|nr:MAG: hypothetical protein M1819_005663 [Sarea resinae]
MATPSSTDAAAETEGYQMEDSGKAKQLAAEADDDMEASVSHVEFASETPADADTGTPSSATVDDGGIEAFPDYQEYDEDLQSKDESKDKQPALLADDDEYTVSHVEFADATTADSDNGAPYSKTTGESGMESFPDYQEYEEGHPAKDMGKQRATDDDDDHHHHDDNDSDEGLRVRHVEWADDLTGNQFDGAPSAQTTGAGNTPKDSFPNYDEDNEDVDLSDDAFNWPEIIIQCPFCGSPRCAGDGHCYRRSRPPGSTGSSSSSGPSGPSSSSASAPGPSGVVPGAPAVQSEGDRRGTLPPGSVTARISTDQPKGSSSSSSPSSAASRRYYAQLNSDKTSTSGKHSTKEKENTDQSTTVFRHRTGSNASTESSSSVETVLNLSSTGSGLYRIPGSAGSGPGHNSASTKNSNRNLPAGQLELPKFIITPPTPPPSGGKGLPRPGRRRSNEISHVEEDDDFSPAVRTTLRRSTTDGMSMNFPSFLDSPSPGMPNNINQLPRAPVSPAPSQHAQVNGVGAMAGMGGFPTNAGHQMDLNHLWNTVQELSTVLDNNRAQTQHIVSRVDELRTRATAEGAPPALQQVNGEMNSSARIADLEARLAAKEREVAQLNYENEEMASLHGTYENALGRVMDMIRSYVYNQTQETLAIHTRYNDQLAAERQECLALRLEHADWQGRLGSLAENIRLAHRAASEVDENIIRAMAELRSENRCLRQLHGLPVDEDEDEIGGGNNRPDVASSSAQDPQQSQQSSSGH